MTTERRTQIEELGKAMGLGFADAKRMLEEIENDDNSYEQTMCEIAY